MNAVSSRAPTGWTVPRSRRPVALSALSLAMDPEGFFERRLARHGDPFIVGMPGIGDVLVSGHPDGAREIFSAPPDAFEPLRSNPLEPMLGRHSVLLLSGERHRRERKLMTPPFHGERMRAYGEIIRERTRVEVARWRPGSSVVLGPAMRRITLDVILRAVIGIDGEPRSERFRAAAGEMLDAYTPLLLVLPALRRSFGPFGPWVRFARAREAVRALFGEEIRARRQRGTEGREDILSLLMEARYDDGSALSDEELIDELRTLIVAGHDTTTTALVWGLLHLHTTPAALDSLRSELAPLGPEPSAEAFERLPYLGAVCSEALRLHPVVPIVPRRAVAPMTFRGQSVRSGQSIAMATTLLHMRPDVWNEPHRFSPERFLTKKYSPFEYAPFGGGVRRCIGAAFGAYQMRIVLGTILSLARFERHEGALPRRVLMSITMGPRGAVSLRLGARGAVAA